MNELREYQNARCKDKNSMSIQKLFSIKVLDNNSGGRVIAVGDTNFPLQRRYVTFSIII